MGSPFTRGLEAGQRLKDARVNTKIRENALAAQQQVQKDREAHLSGDVEAMGRLVTVSPEAAIGFMDALDRMKPDEVAQKKEAAEMMGRMSSYVLRGETPEEQARRWQIVRANVDPAIAGSLPAEYDPSLPQFYLARAVETDKMIDLTEKRRLKEEDREHALTLEGVKHENTLATEGAKHENALAATTYERTLDREDKSVERGYGVKESLEERRNALADADAEHKRKLELESVKTENEIRKANETKKLEKPEGLSASESNSVRATVAELFGGLYDPTNGRISGLDRDQAARVNDLAARAEQIYLDAKERGQPIGANEAVQRARTETKGDQPAGGGGGTKRLRFNPQTGTLE